MISEEGGGSVELKPNSRNIPVTAADICKYVHLYVLHRMGENQSDALRLLRLGVMEAYLNIPVGGENPVCFIISKFFYMKLKKYCEKKFRTHAS